MATIVSEILGHALSGAINVPFALRPLEAVAEAWSEPAGDDRLILVTGT